MIWQRVLFGITCSMLLLISNPILAKKDKSEVKTYFVVLDETSVLLHQQNISGGARLKSTRFRAKSLEAQNYARALQKKQHTLEQQIYSIDNNAKVLHRFNKLVNAFTVQVDPANLGDLQEIPGVAYISPIRSVKLMLTNSSELMSLPMAWEHPDLNNNAGQDIFIAIIDTGIDITHPAFNSEGYSYPEGFPKGNPDFTTEKVIASRSFPPVFGNQGDASLFDRMGHGTNVASIAAANANSPSPLGNLSGVAPQAYLGNYKVFTSDTADNEQIIRAIESAVEDGVDIINLSLGSDVFADPYHDLMVEAVRNAIDLGVVVVIAAGNDGGEPYTIGNPAQVDQAITVGSITNSHFSNGNPSAFDVQISVYADGDEVISKVPAVIGGSGGPYTESIIGEFPLKDIDLLDGGGYGGLTNGLVCEPLNLDQPLDAYVLAMRGECNFVDKTNNLSNAGAMGVLYIDNKENASLDWLAADGTTIPSMLMDKISGLLIKDAIQSSQSVIIKIDGDPISDNNMAPNLLSTYSAEGPSVGNILKPDIVTIGEGSFAGTQNDDASESEFNASGYQWLSGTSMSSPRVAGLAAIMRQLHPDWPPAWIKSALTLSAKQQVYKKNNKSQEAMVLERGAGAVDAEEALTVDSIVVPSLIGFGVYMFEDATPKPEWITIVNPTDHECSFTLMPSDDAANQGITISISSFTLSANEKIEIEISFSSISGLQDGDNQGILILTNSTTNQSYEIPYWMQKRPSPEPYGDIILVDDDNGQSFENYYMDRLDEINIDYTWWDVNSYEGYPTLDYLSQFKTVIWFMADNTLNSIHDESSPSYRRMYNSHLLYELDMMQYLIEGGSMILSGQDYSDDKETAAFTQEILSVRTSDYDNGASTIQGVSNHPFADGLGPFTMTFPEGFENWTDFLTPTDNNRVERAFMADGNRARTTGVTIDTSSYRAIFLAFPLEVLDEVASATILQKGLQWLWEKEPVESPIVTEISPSTIDITQDSGPYEITIKGNGFIFKNGYRAFLDFIPLTDITRNDDNTLTAKAPAGIDSGKYTLRLVTGDGHHLRLENAFTASGASGTNVLDWALY
jgi:minor extracellular serine protease Vpr